MKEYKTNPAIVANAAIPTAVEIHKADGFINCSSQKSASSIGGGFFPVLTV